MLLPIRRTQLQQIIQVVFESLLVSGDINSRLQGGLFDVIGCQEKENAILWLLLRKTGFVLEGDSLALQKKKRVDKEGQLIR